MSTPLRSCHLPCEEAAASALEMHGKSKKAASRSPPVFLCALFCWRFQSVSRAKSSRCTQGLGYVAVLSRLVSSRIKTCLITIVFIVTHHQRSVRHTFGFPPHCLNRYAELYPDEVDRIFMLCPSFCLGTRAPTLASEPEMAEWERTGAKGTEGTLQR